MTITVFPADAVGGIPIYSSRQVRQALSLIGPMGTPTRPLGCVSGVRFGTDVVNTVQATAATWTVNPHAGTIDAESSAAAGSYMYAIDAAVTGSITAAVADRLDLISVQISDQNEGDGTITPPQAQVVYTVGSSPTVPPTAPARSLTLAYVTVHSSGAPTVAWVAPQIDGDVVVFQTQAQLTAAGTSRPLGARARVVADPTATLNATYEHVSSGWAYSSAPTTSFTATLSGISGTTISSASSYRISSGMCIVTASFTWSGMPSSFSQSGGLTVSLPMNAPSTSVNLPTGSGYLLNGSAYYPISGFLSSTTQAGLYLLTGSPTQWSGNIATLTPASAGTVAINLSFPLA